MKNSDATAGNGVTEENPVTRLMETVSTIIEFVKAHHHEPKVFRDIPYEFDFSQKQEDLRIKLAKEFRSRLQVCKVRFHQAGLEDETISEWSDWLKEPVEAILYFDQSIRQMKVSLKKSSSGEWTFPDNVVEEFVGRKIGEVTAALQPFEDMEEVFRPVPAMTPRVQHGKPMTIDQRMRLLMDQKPESLGWTVTEFQNELKCSRGGIAKTPCWNMLESARKLGKIERRKDRR